jgi:NAD(P)-dependent dehydrogenase (short-subunit alcohol dehydrogenase family)
MTEAKLFYNGRRDGAPIYMSDFLKDKTAVITGASRGLGKAMALALADAGVRLALVARDEAKLVEVATLVRERGVEAECYRVDVTSESDVLELEVKVRERFGKAQILINNAGVNLRKPVTEFSYQDWRYVLDTNLTGAFLLCRSFVPHMKGTGYGRIINSIMSHVSLPERIAYSSSKAGLLGLTRALALELATEGVTVVGISPGPFATEMNTPLINDPVKNAQFLDSIPVHRWGKVEDIGALARFLCSEEASFITGTDIVIDGGWLAR